MNYVRALIAIVLVLMLIILAGCDAVAKLPGEPGELVYQRGSSVWRLQQTQCKHEDLVEALIGDGKIGEHKAAVIQSGDRSWSACWAQDFDSDVLIADVTGARGFMPKNWFTKR